MRKSHAKSAKKYTRPLAGSSEIHAKMSVVEMRRARTLAAESLHASERARCDDALADLHLASVAFGRGQAHAQEARHHERPEMVAARDLLADARDAIRVCFRSTKR